MRDVLLDQTLFSLTPQQTKTLLADLDDPGFAAQDQARIEQLLAMAQPWYPTNSVLRRSAPGR